MGVIMKYTYIVSALALSVGACQVGPSLEEREAAYLGLSEAHWQSTLNRVDDPLNPTIEIDTRAGYRDYPFSFGPKDDQFLRARVPRNESTILLQGYVTSEIRGNWLMPQSVGFADVIPSRGVSRVSFDVYGCGGGIAGDCLYYEEMVFDLSLEDLDALIEHAEKSSERFVRFRVQGQSGIDRDGRFHLNELKAMREALEGAVG